MIAIDEEYRTFQDLVFENMTFCVYIAFPDLLLALLTKHLRTISPIRLTFNDFHDLCNTSMKFQ